MARRYDSSTTTFSPEGRLHQVRTEQEDVGVGSNTDDGMILTRKWLSVTLSASCVFL